jgi:O-antigen biosynthesis protein
MATAETLMGRCSGQRDEPVFVDTHIGTVPRDAHSEEPSDKGATRIAALEATLRARDETIWTLNHRLTAIYASPSWRIAAFCTWLWTRILPLGSFRRRLAGRIARGLLAQFQPAARDVAGTAIASDPYALWIAKNEPNARKLARQRKTKFARPVHISLLVSIDDAPAAHLAATLNSVLAQTYPHWEVHLSGQAGATAEAAGISKIYARNNARIRLKPLESGGLTNGTVPDYLAVLHPGDTLAPSALYEIVRAVHEDAARDFLYSDEDLLDAEGRRLHPHFKPDWSPDTLRSHNFIGSLAVIRRDLWDRAGGLRDGFDGSQDYDLVLRATEQASQVHHISRVLYHGRHRPESSTNGALRRQAHHSAKKALREHLQRLAIEGSVGDGLSPDTYDVRRTFPGRPLVSIVIPTQDHVDVLARCLDSIARSTYPHYEVLLIENRSRNPQTFDYYRKLERQSRIRVLSWDCPFNYSKLNNFAAAHARGEVLLLLNNDTEAQTADWLERMLEHALRPEVGAVGAKLYYPGGDVQHAGVIVGVDGVARHAHRHFPASSTGYRHRLVTTQNLSAVTAACLMLRKSVFEEIGGFDERLEVAINDVDLCLRIRRKGYWILWTPFAELTHCESRTRGPDDDDEKRCRVEKETGLFLRSWRKELQRGDPFYSPHLTLTGEDFALRL